MMHQSVMNWAKTVVDTYGLAGKAVLEVGSYDVNGSPRFAFNGPYLGCDITVGPGVDVVADAQSLHLWRDGEWEAVVSTEMLEHCPRPWIAVNEMARVVESGGWVLLTARGYDERGCWEVHGYPHDYFRFSDRSMRLLVEDAGLTLVDLQKDPEGPGWMVVARKHP